ncbi:MULTISPECIES: uroporphyrinogen decarboxylase/cobalamine-independent methonine synthase family protein [Dickeya]|uniref:Methionine synthase II (Cobalamin-independent) n=1 Tax=Dickeya aquatica TaxID=1401087 RepID=A0A375ADC1_9GAMM|nr:MULTISPECIES: methionine synthase [Dickeya]SLM64082.1 Methionine synthase II (cobalamin-independent) [Dickeya aquatica]
MYRTVKKPYPPFHAEHVGSFLLPSRLAQARKAWKQGRMTHDKLTEIENEEVLRVVACQKACGLMAITDGELRIVNGMADFFSSVHGIAYDEANPARDDAPFTLRVTEKLRFPSRHPFLQHYRFLHQAVAPDGRVMAKQVLPSPNMLMYPSIRHNAVYPSLPLFCDDVIALYRNIIQAFYQQGCRYLQLDDLFWAYLCDPRIAQYEQAAGLALHDLLALCVRNLNQALAERPHDMYISLHICCRRFTPNWVHGIGRDVMTYAMANLAVDSLFIEYDDSRSVALEPLRKVGGQKVVLGVVDAQNSALEKLDSIKMAINTASLYVPLQQLAISPKCGFRHCDHQRITEEQQWDKLRNMVDIARRVWVLPE